MTTPVSVDLSEAGRLAGFNLTHLSLFPMPNLDDIEGGTTDSFGPRVLGQIVQR